MVLFKNCSLKRFFGNPKNGSMESLQKPPFGSFIFKSECEWGLQLQSLWLIWIKASFKWMNVNEWMNIRIWSCSRPAWSNRRGTVQRLVLHAPMWPWMKSGPPQKTSSSWEQEPHLNVNRERMWNIETGLNRGTVNHMNWQVGASERVPV